MILDMRTVLNIEGFLFLICFIVFFILWLQVRKRFNGLRLWTSHFFLGALGSLLLSFREYVPAWVSIPLANSLIAGGFILLFLGSLRFIGKKIPWWIGSLCLVAFSVFVFLHTYYTFVDDDLIKRIFNISVAMGLFSFLTFVVFQWTSDNEVKRYSLGTRIAALIITIVLAGRLFGIAQIETNDFMASGVYDTTMVLAFCLSVVFLAFNLVLTVNRRNLTGIAESESNFRRSIDDSPLAIRITDLEARTVYGNQKLLDLYGYESIDNFIKIPFEERYSPESAQRLYAYIQNLKEAKDHPDVYYLDINKTDGTIRNLEVYHKEIIWNGTRHFQGTCIDITEQVETREREEKLKVELQNSERDFRNSIDSSPLAIVINRGVGNAIYANKAAFNLFGYTDISEFTRITPSERFSPEVLEKIKERQQKLFDGVSAFERESYEITRKDGSTRYIEATTSLIKWDDFDAIMVVFRDITEQKQAENEIIRRNQELEAFGTQVPGMLYIFKKDANGHYSVPYCNAAVKDIYGCTPEEVKDDFTPIERTFHPDDYQKVMDSIIESETNLTPWEFEFRVQVPGEDIKIIWGRSTPQSQEDGSIEWYGFLTDVTTQKQAEQQLMLRAQVLDKATDSICLINRDGVLEYINDTFSTIRGYTKQELLGKSMAEIPSIATPELFERLDKELAKTGYAVFETTHFHKDGTPIDFEVHSSVIRVNDEMYSLNVEHDITERKRILESLRRSNQLLETSQQLAKLGGWSYDIVSEKNFWTDNMYKLYKVPSDFNIDDLDLITDYFPGDHKQILLDHFETAVKEGMPFDLELEFIDAEENLFWVRGTGEPIYQDGKIVKVEGNLQDISERKQAEKELYESEQNFRNSIDTSPLGIIINRGLGKPVYANKAALTMFGSADLEEMRATPSEEIFPSDKLEVIRARTERLMRKESTLEQDEYYIRRQDGSHIYVELHATSVVWDGADCVLAIFQDISERREAQEREQQLQQELIAQSRLATVGEMAAGIAHEINNPLTGVVGFSSLLLQRDLPDDVKNELSIINEGAQRVASIVSRMLAFARQNDLVFDKTDINKLIDSTLSMQSHDLQLNDIDVVRHLTPDLPSIAVDSGQIQQVFLNIIINAEIEMKKAHQGGTLTITTTRVDDSIRVIFEDDGPGILEDDIKRIFDPFYTTRTVGEGTGLGLSVSYGIIQNHHGKIWAENNETKGARFIVELPIIRQMQEGKSSENGKTAIETLPSTATVLVVDDEEIIRKLLQEMLKKEGYEVTVAESGEKARTLLNENEYDILLLDIRMPDINGIDLYENIRNRSEEQAKKVIFVTGDTMSKDTLAYLITGKIPYVTKPFSRETILEEINKVMAQGA